MDEEKVIADSVKVPKWLKRLQENSWEAELLISGGAVFALLSFSDYLIEIIRIFKFSSNLMGTDLSAILIMGAVNGITIGFILHIILRGIWIALVCLNFSFAHGIKFEKLKLSWRYAEKAQAYRLTDQIIYLDHASGLIFFSSFAFFIVAIGYFIFNFVSFVTSSIIVELISHHSVSEPDFFFFPLNLVFIVFLIDMFSAGWLRRNKIIGKIYYPIYYVFNGISLAFIYRPWFQILFTNISKVRAFMFSAFFLVITIAYTNLSLKKLFHWRTFLDQFEYPAAPIDGPILNTFYDNHLRDEIVFYASIPSETVTGKNLRVFIPYRKAYEDGIVKANGKYFSDIVKVCLNNDTALKVDWVAINHEITGQRGIITILPIENLPSGRNVLKVRIEDAYFDSRHGRTREILFWKE